ncbi:MAG TPA: hypothetical protein VE132_13145 [Micromonosporaceae bacterium]|nr:hypothetical protein [Micromonosporaceae bacterium]
MPRIGSRSRQSLYGVALLVYPAALLAAALDWRWAFAVLGLATFPAEALFTRRAPLAYGVLRLADAGRAVRGATRSFGLVLLTAVAFHRTADIVLVAAFMFAIEAARAGTELIGIVVPARRRMHMVTRNLDISAMRISDRTVGPVERIDARTMSYLAVAPLIGVIVSAATDSAAPIVVGALVGAVVGVGIVAVGGTHALAARRMPSRRTVTSVVKTQIAAYAPQVAIYFSGGATSAYQINMWLEVAARLDQRVLIILRERPILDELAPTSLPVLCVPGAVDLMDLDMPTVRVALYAANTGKNIHFLRLPGMAHVFIGHGDSDKVASINPFCKVYDEVWVAGPAGRERFARAMIGVDDQDVFEVGRPQLAPIERGPRKADEPITVLYAPTWEGWTDDPLNTSLMTMGRALVAAILDHPDGVRLIYKPHPLTGRRSAKASAENEAIIAMIDKANAARAASRSATAAEASVNADAAAGSGGVNAVAEAKLASLRAAIDAVTGNADADEAMIARDSAGSHVEGVRRASELTEQWTTTYWASRPEWIHRIVTDALPTLFDCFNHSDLLVTDISSVVADYLYSEKPYVVTNSAALDHDVFRNRYPTAGAAELLDPDCATLPEIITSVGAGSDRLVEQRRKLKEHLLGADDQSPFERFRMAMNRVIATVDSAPRPDWDNSEFEPEPDQSGRHVLRFNDTIER